MAAGNVCVCVCLLRDTSNGERQLVECVCVCVSEGYAHVQSVIVSSLSPLQIVDSSSLDIFWSLECGSQCP